MHPHPHTRNGCITDVIKNTVIPFIELMTMSPLCNKTTFGKTILHKIIIFLWWRMLTTGISASADIGSRHCQVWRAVRGCAVQVRHPCKSAFALISSKSIFESLRLVPQVQSIANIKDNASQCHFWIYIAQSTSAGD